MQSGTIDVDEYMQPARPARVGSLAAWQVERARAMLSARLAGGDEQGGRLAPWQLRHLRAVVDAHRRELFFEYVRERYDALRARPIPARRGRRRRGRWRRR